MLTLLERRALVKWMASVRRSHGLSMSTLGRVFRGSGSMNWEEQRQLSWKSFLEVAGGSMRIWARFSGKNRQKQLPEDLVDHGGDLYSRDLVRECMPEGLWKSIEEDFKLCYPRTCWRGTYLPEELLVIPPGECPAQSLQVVKLLPRKFEKLVKPWEIYLKGRFVRFIFGAWWTSKNYKRVRNCDWWHVPEVVRYERAADYEQYWQMPPHLVEMMEHFLAKWEGGTPAERAEERAKAPKRKIAPPTPWNSGAYSI